MTNAEFKVAKMMAEKGFAPGPDGTWWQNKNGVRIARSKVSDEWLIGKPGYEYVCRKHLCNTLRSTAKLRPLKGTAGPPIENVGDLIRPTRGERLVDARNAIREVMWTVDDWKSDEHKKLDQIWDYLTKLIKEATL
jgi:hypothetical protein